MLGWIVAAVAVVAALVLLPWLLSFMPRDQRGGGGGLGPALSELNALFNPAERHVEAAQRQLPAERENDEPKD